MDAHNDRRKSLDFLRRCSSAARPVPELTARIWPQAPAMPLAALTWRSRSFPGSVAKLKTAPPVLWAVGNLRILDSVAFGLCGSRHASERGIGWARHFGAILAEEHATLVTGLAQGVDLTATKSALEAGGTCIGVLAEGIGRWMRRDLLTAIQSGSLLILSEFRPNARWSVGQAMQRNATICVLGQAMFVIEAGETGGTLAAGRTALRLGVPLYAVRSALAVPGNEILVSEGAEPLATPRELRAVVRSSMDSFRRTGITPSIASGDQAEQYESADVGEPEVHEARTMAQRHMVHYSE